MNKISIKWNHSVCHKEEKKERVKYYTSSLKMAEISYCCFSTLSSRSNLQTSTWAFEANRGLKLAAKGFSRRNLRIKAEVDYVDAEEAKKLIAVEGYTIVDVRDRLQFERAHIKSCYHVPLFIENKDNDISTIINRQLHNFSGLFYGLPFTKQNPDFVKLVKNQFSPESKLLIVCQGLRSSAVARKLEEAGFQNISCVTSGLQSVKPGIFDVVGSTELKDAGKAGLVQIQGAFLFITFFPDQAEKLLQMAPTSQSFDTELQSHLSFAFNPHHENLKMNFSTVAQYQKAPGSVLYLSRGLHTDAILLSLMF